MVKRKANVSIDEWLGGEASLTDTTQDIATTTEERPVAPNDPTAERVSNETITERGSRTSTG